MILIGVHVGLERSNQIQAIAACVCVPAYESFRVETEIVWKEGHFWESWDEYHYASEFFATLNGYYLAMMRHFRGLSRMEDASTRFCSHHSGASI